MISLAQTLGMHWSKLPNADEIRARISAKKKANPTRYWTGKSHSLETKLKISETKKVSPETVRGEDHHNWKGGVEPESSRYRGKLLYRIWQDAVFQRDGNICRDCGKDTTGLHRHAHHIKDFMDHPELRYAIDNGMTLCSSCHPKRHAKERRAAGLPVGRPRKTHT